MDNAKLIIYDTNWKEVGVIDAYASLIWTKRYTSCGDFELHMPFKKRYVQILKLNYFVCLDKQEAAGDKYAMIIEHTEINQSAESVTTLTIKGRSLLSILYRRVLYSELVMTDTKFGFISKLINSCFNGSNARKLGDGLNWGYAIFNHTTDRKKRLRSAGKGDNLGEIIEKFCESTGTGIDMIYDGTAYLIYVYEFESKEDSVIFSSALDNLANCTYIEDISNFANVARVSSNQITITSPKTEDSENAKHTGLDRYEKSLTTDITNQSPVFAALRANGALQLREYSTSKEITAEIINTKTYCYEDDYRVGDIVKIITDFGITAIAQIKEMTESWDIEGHSLIPTFSNYQILEEEEDE